MNAPFRIPLMSRPTWRRQLLASTLDGLYAGVHGFAPFFAAKHFQAPPWLVVVYLQLGAIAMLAAPVWAGVLARASRPRVFHACALFGRVTCLGLAFTDSAWAFLGLASLGSLIQPLVIPAVNSIWQANYPSAIRGRVMGRISFASWAGVAGGVYGAGWILDRDPGAYRWIFPLAGLLGAAALWCYGAIRLRRRAMQPIEGAHGPLAPWRDALRLLRTHRLFAHYELGFMVYGFGFFFVQPLLAVHCARDLGLDYAVFGTASAVQQVVQGAMNPVWGAWWDRLGSARTAVGAFGLLGPFALAMAFVDSPLAIYAAFALFGVAMSGVHVAWNLGSVEFAGREDSERFMTVHATCVGVRSTVVPPLALLVLAWRGEDARYAFLAGAACFAASVIVMLRLHRAVDRAGAQGPESSVQRPASGAAAAASAPTAPAADVSVPAPTVVGD